LARGGFVDDNLIADVQLDRHDSGVSCRPVEVFLLLQQLSLTGPNRMSPIDISKPLLTEVPDSYAEAADGEEFMPISRWSHWVDCAGTWVMGQRTPLQPEVETVQEQDLVPSFKFLL
jgi:hypothetical protein